MSATLTGEALQQQQRHGSSLSSSGKCLLIRPSLGSCPPAPLRCAELGGGAAAHCGREQPRLGGPAADQLHVACRPSCRYGPLNRVEIKRNYAFVEFKNLDDAIDAQKRSHGTSMDGRTITVEFVESSRLGRERWAFSHPCRSWLHRRAVRLCLGRSSECVACSCCSYKAG